MTSKAIAESSQNLELRVTSLETELEQLKRILSESLGNKEPWWLNIVGSFENDSSFDEAVRLGQEWRKSAE